jgi:ankyrin repeat protein
MAQLTTADLKQNPTSYESLRDVSDVLIGEYTARPLIEASSSSDDATLQSFLSQPQWTKTMLEKPHAIYSIGSSKDQRYVLAKPTSNIERCLKAAAGNGHAAVMATVLAFAKTQSVDLSDFTTRSVVNTAISSGHGAVFEALASADPKVINFPLPHGALPLYEAARLRKPDVVAALLKLGADPLHPVGPSKKLASYHSSLLSHAAFSKGPRMTGMLLEHGIPIARTGALHTAARVGQLDTMRLLMEHGADVNETLANWHGWTPTHFAANMGQIDAMKLLEDHGACSDVKDMNGKTAAQLLEEHDTA